jgi:hypothetical protein
MLWFSFRFLPSYFLWYAYTSEMKAYYFYATLRILWAFTLISTLSLFIGRCRFHYCRVTPAIIFLCLLLWAIFFADDINEYSCCLLPAAFFQFAESAAFRSQRYATPYIFHVFLSQIRPARLLSFAYTADMIFHDIITLSSIIYAILQR